MNSAFFDNLTSSLQSIGQATEIDVSEAVRRLKEVITDEHTYLFARALLLRLSKETSNGKNTGLVLQRISSELERLYSADSGPFDEAIRFIGKPSTDLIMAITRITSKTIQASDIQKLFAYYSDRDHPSIEYIRDPRFFNALLNDVFGVNSEPTMTDKKIWLLAFASCAKDTLPGEISDHGDKIEDAVNSLQFLRGVISTFTPAMDMSEVFIGLLDATKIPIAREGLLLWIRRAIGDPSFYESNAVTLSEDLPFLFELLDEIEIKKRYVDRLVFVTKLGYVLPVLRRIELDYKLDETLTIYFLNELIASL
ncbi:beta ketoadipyl CoA thiolase, th1 [Phlyctochytrium planicorne]|nr:beta ketoadipyl CoA thiolase, th1 [Phlyctochytrium planicorne]